ncbi:hypothetical protein GCM10019016_136510 [Streptomyces prasinosporus]|uniref:Alanine dehydrogenase/pyridine nucleotide transhydrogenase NAD(H)-binding domain-containing protein n=1 Tax=Streptomyces prasinosporus TaxID=68256 RepID=A0ABP6UJD8_9ACTN
MIGAVLVPGAKAPKLVTNELVSRMKAGSVLVDIAIDQGGCFEDSHPTTHAEPTFTVHDSVFYCVANMPGRGAQHLDLRAHQRHAAVHRRARQPRLGGGAAPRPRRSPRASTRMTARWCTRRSPRRTGLEHVELASLLG